MKLQQVGKLLVTAGGSVTLVFGLFNSALAEWAPPTSGLSPLAVTGLASTLALVLLLVLVMSLHQQLLAARRPWVVSIAVGLALLGVGVFFSYYSLLDQHVFRWPQGSADAPRYVRGEYTELGRQMTRDMSLPAAIGQVGGLEMARSQQLLWEETSAQQVEHRLVGWYLLLTSLFSAVLFSLALAVQGTTEAESLEGEGA